MKIEIIGTFYNNHSLSIVNRNLVTQLYKNKYDVYITPLDSYDCENKVENEEVLDILDELSAKEAQIEPDIQVRHTYPPIWRWPLSNKTKVVFIQPWEFSKVPFEWQYKWEQFADAIICPSYWNRDRYLEAGINPDKLFVVPNGYNPEVFYPDRTKKNKLFTFTFVGCNQYRKGLDILLETWPKAFEKADNVRLIIKDTPNIYGDNNLLDQILKLQYKYDCAKIELDAENRSEAEMAELYKQTDVLVHPFRGEGFGMHIQEAMACGALPLISRGGAPEIFVNDNNGLFIEVTTNIVDLTDPLYMASKPGDSFTGMHQYGTINEPNKQDLLNKLRTLYHSHNRDEIIDRVKNAELFTWEAAGEIFANTLKQIHSFTNVHRV